MTTSADLHAQLAAMTKDGWRSAFEVDVEGLWWLAENGYRRRYPWRPADEMDVLLAACLLYILNDAGDVPLPGDFVKELEKRRRSVDLFRERLMINAMKLHRQLLVGHPPPTT